jgi:hypothetical protein
MGESDTTAAPRGHAGFALGRIERPRGVFDEGNPPAPVEQGVDGRVVADVGRDPKRTISSGSSSSRSTSAFGLVKGSKCFFRIRNSRPRSQCSGTGPRPSGTGSSCFVSVTRSAPRVPRRQCGGKVADQSGVSEISSSVSS